MSDQAGIVKYKASDGSDVQLSPDIVAKYVLTGGQQVSDREIYAFLAKCQARRLNPLAGDAYMTCYKDKHGNVNASVIVSKDYFVRTATQQPSFDGFRAGVVVANKRTGQLTYREGSIVGKASETLVGGWAEVFDKTRSHPSHIEVSLEEYDQHRSLWTTKPATMIRKVALVQALREAYPGTFGGVYDSTEMPEEIQSTHIPEPEPHAVTTVTATVEPVPEPAPVQQAQAPQQRSKNEPLQAVRDRYRPWCAAMGYTTAEGAEKLAQAVNATSMATLTPEQCAEACRLMDAAIAVVQAAQEPAKDPEPEQAPQPTQAVIDVDANGDLVVISGNPELYEEEADF